MQSHAWLLRQNDVETMKHEVRELEIEYERLCSINSAGDARLRATVGGSSTIRDRYEQARGEAAALRAQIGAMKEKLAEYDLFASALETYAAEFAAPTPAKTLLLREPPDPFEPLSEETCFAIIQQCYQQIYFPQWRGKRISTGAQLFGWRDERFVDGTTLQFSLTKTFENLGMEHMMLQTWNIVTREEHKHTIQKSTIGVKVLQVINDDVMVTQRCVHHPQLQKVTCVNMLMFRLRTERGYIVAYVTIDHPSSSTSPTNARRGGTSRNRSGGGSSGNTRATFIDIDEFTGERGGSGGGEKAKVSWVDTLQWFIFEEAQTEQQEPMSPAVREVASPDVARYTNENACDEFEMDEDLAGFAASLMDTPPSELFVPMFDNSNSSSSTSTAATVTGSASPSPSPCPSPAPSLSSPVVNVTFGGRMDNKDLNYVSYFLVEIVSMIVRWDQAVAYSRLPFSVDCSNSEAAPAPSPWDSSKGDTQWSFN